MDRGTTSRSHGCRAPHRAVPALPIRESYGIPKLIDEARARGFEVRRFPIRDLSVPRSFPPVRELVDEILAAARAGGRVVIHRAGGIGRAGTIGGCVLVATGKKPDGAIDILHRVRGLNCPERPEQERFIHDFARLIEADS